MLSRVKQITSPGWMHETSAQGWCTGKTQRDQVEREVGGGIRMGNTCKSMADSCQCMTKTTTIKKIKIKNKKWAKKKKETHFRPRNTYRLEVRGWRKIFHGKRNQKKAEVVIQSDKIDFKAKTFMKQRTAHNY